MQVAMAHLPPRESPMPVIARSSTTWQ